MAFVLVRSSFFISSHSVYLNNFLNDPPWLRCLLLLLQFSHYHQNSLSKMQSWLLAFSCLKPFVGWSYSIVLSIPQVCTFASFGLCSYLSFIWTAFPFCAWMSLHASFNAKFKWPLIGEGISDFSIQPQTELIALASVLSKHFINNIIIIWSIYLIFPLDYAIYKDRDYDWFFLFSHYPLHFLVYSRGFTKGVKWMLIMAWIWHS